jgi:hypothetical protein
MRNAKLRKTVTIPELTQENIDSAEDVSGTVNPSVVSFGGGGGGDEVLKDWTVVAGLSENLLSGMQPSDIEGAVIEFKNLRGAGPLGLDFLVNGEATPFTNGYNKISLQTKSYTAGAQIGGSNQRMILNDSSYYEGSGKVSLYGITGVWPYGVSLSYFAEVEHVNSTPAVVVTKNLVTVYKEGSKNITSLEVVLSGSSDGDGIFNAEYRIVRK